MGSCCSGSTIDRSSDIKTLDAAQLRATMTPTQMALIIKVQAYIRGYITRKRIRHMKYTAGMAAYVYEDGINDYDNPKVQVSIKKHIKTNFYCFYSKSEKNLENSTTMMNQILETSQLSTDHKLN